MRTSLIFFLVIVSTNAWSQQLIPMAAWRSHFNYEETFLVEKTTNNIFATTSHGLIYYDIEDQSINKLSKIDGLGDVGISAIRYDLNENILAIGYQNGNVDIITTEGILNLPVVLKSDRVENKKINHIGFYEGDLNLSTDFGLIVLNQENQVEEAYLNLGETGQTIEIRGSAILNDVMFLATEVGVIAGQLSQNNNLQDFNNWQRYEESIIHAHDILAVAVANDRLYACSSSTLFQWSGQNWSEISFLLDSGEEISRVRNSDSGLILISNFGVYQVNDNNAVTEVSLPNTAQASDILLDGEGNYWYADLQKGLSNYNPLGIGHFVLNGPMNNIEKLKVEENNIYAFPTLQTNISQSLNNELGYSVFSAGSWNTVEPNEMQGFSNITDVKVIDDQLMVTSFGQGILNSTTGEVLNYTNSPLGENEAGTGNTLVTGMLSDEEENVWITNFSTYSLLQWDGNDLWEQFEFGSSAGAQPTSISLNASHQIWMSLGLLNDRGILAYEIESGASRYVTTTSTGLPSNSINDIAFGKQNEIWMATDDGLAYFPFASGIIEDQTIDLTIPIFDETLLFEDKQVNALVVDGGNRLWVGTQDGLWLYDEGFTALVHHFDVDNSPLPSNEILDLALHPVTGELFVATIKGIVSYRTNATEATNKHQLVQIYPNPVLPDFVGLVGFSGLASDVRLKITTINGHLIRELDALGGGVSWDLNDFAGTKVKTGIYLVFSADLEGEETYVGKIAVIE